MMKYNMEHYVGEKIRLFPGDTYSKYGTIVRVDDLGWTVKISESNCSNYIVGREYFISHSAGFKFEFL